MSPRRGARVVEWDGLENRCTCKRTVGSNPTLSAKIAGSLTTVRNAELQRICRVRLRA